MAESALSANRSGATEQILSMVDVVSTCAGICIPPDGIGFRIKYGQNLPTVRGDPVRLRQLFNNLLTNSVHAIEGRGTILIELEKEEPSRRKTDSPTLQVRVIDSGPGIPREIREKIFDKGFSTRKGGSGVGLYAAKNWLEEIGGDIFFEDFPAGEGCCAVVRLPGNDEVDPRTVPIERTWKTAIGRVLVLEDDPMVTDILGEMLEHLGCETVTTADGRETVRLYEDAFRSDDAFHVVILDLNVPGGQGGVETAFRIREIDPKARLFISSGQNVGEVMEDPASLGFTGKLHKPYSLEELSKILNG